METRPPDGEDAARPGHRLRRALLIVWTLVLIPAAGVTLYGLALVVTGGVTPSGDSPLRLLAGGLGGLFLASAGIALNLERGRLALLLAALGGAAALAPLLFR